METTKFAFNISRIWKYYKDKNFGIVSAYLGNLSKTENKDRQKKLKQMVRDAGYGYKEIKGVWRPDIDAQAEFEYALFIPNAQKEDIKAWGKEFKQYAVIYTDKDNIILDNLGHEENKVFDKFETGLTESWITWSEFKRHNFKFSSVIWDIQLPPEPTDWFRAMAVENYVKEGSVHDYKE